MSYSVVEITVLSVKTHCPFYKEGDSFIIKQQCFDPSLASPKMFCIHSLYDLYPTYRRVRSGEIGNIATVGCMDNEIVTFELKRLPDEEGEGWN